MKHLILFVIALFLLSSCKDNEKENSENFSSDSDLEIIKSDSINTSNAPNTPITSVDEVSEINKEKAKEIPADLQAIFSAHGGLNRWKKMNNLCFEMKGENGDEVHTVSLPDRKTRIESKDWSIGYDGKKVWLLRHDVGYKGDPVFYHNLMFYFYAMPFVIADPGTNYVTLEPTELDGKMYNAFKVSYNDGVGDSSKDEYRLYFDPETNKMAWLAYTVTFKYQKKSTDWHYIKYDKWQDVNGLSLPEKLSWYKVENGKPKGKDIDMKFTNIAITETSLDPSVFTKPAEGRYVD